MARSFTLKVTKPLILAAARENSAKCMIALAVHEAGGTYPQVTKESISFNVDRIRYSFPTPARAAAELIKFDKGEDINPFVVYLHGKTASSRPVRERSEPVKRSDIRKVLKGARKSGDRSAKHPGRSYVRGTRRAQGLRVIEEKE